MVAITIALLALALQPAIVPHQRLRAVTARLGASPVLQLDGQGATPVRRALGMKSSSRTIYIDGNNLMMQRKVTKGREKLAERLTGIRGADVVIVFDGRAGETHSESGHGPRVVITQGGDENGAGMRESADEWIMAQMAGPNRPSRDVEVSIVTADRLLRKEAQRVSAKTINPVKFWSRYLPRLKGLKSNYENATPSS